MLNLPAQAHTNTITMLHVPVEQSLAKFPCIRRMAHLFWSKRQSVELSSRYLWFIFLYCLSSTQPFATITNINRLQMSGNSRRICKCAIAVEHHFHKIDTVLILWKTHESAHASAAYLYLSKSPLSIHLHLMVLRYVAVQLPGTTLFFNLLNDDLFVACHITNNISIQTYFPLSPSLSLPFLCIYMNSNVLFGACWIRYTCAMCMLSNRWWERRSHLFDGLFFVDFYFVAVVYTANNKCRLFISFSARK